MPSILRDAAVIHGLRTLIQNAVDFAASRVEIRATRDRRDLSIRITDDGPGFSAAAAAHRQPVPDHRPAATTAAAMKAWGLGLFIAKTLLQGSGARL